MYHYLNEMPIEITEHSSKGSHHYYVLKSSPENFQLKQYDPLLILKICGQHINVIGGTVRMLPDNEGVFMMQTDLVHNKIEKKNYKKYPASIAVGIKERETKKRYDGLIKDISNYGMKIYSACELEIDCNVEISLSTGMTMYFIDAIVKNVLYNEAYYEYGLLVSANDVQSTRDMKQFLRIYQESCVNRISPDILDNTLDVEYIFEVDENSSMTKKLDSAAAKLETILKRNKD